MHVDNYGDSWSDIDFHESSKLNFVTIFLEIFVIRWAAAR